MKRPPAPMQAALRSFRALTGAPADGAATRARVLGRVRRRRGRRASSRRLVIAALATMAISISASAAWTAFSPAWRSAPAIVLQADAPPGAVQAEPPPRPAIRTIPAAPVPRVPAQAETEAASYARAHRAHFVDRSPARALAAWTAYLRRFPNGALAPEAAFNRALCLVQLGRADEAARALQSFAARPDGYRHAEVERLLDWLHAQPARP